MIERIEALCEAATPGPWESQPSGDLPDHKDIWSESGHFVAGGNIDETDAAFIAHARQLLPLMLEVVKASRAEYDEQLAECDRKDCEWLSNRLWGKSFTALDNYCAEHLPEGSEG